MKVSELIDILATLPRDMEVLLSSDEEGNRYGPVDPSLGECIYKNGEVYAAEDKVDGGEPAIILYPGGAW